MDLGAYRTRFDDSLPGEVVLELIRLEFIERSLALASKLFVAVIPLSIIISAVVPGADNFGDSLVNRLGLTGTGAEATRTLFATNGEIKGAVTLIGLVILLYSVFSFAKGLQRVYLDVWRLPAQQLEAALRRATWVLTFVLFMALLSPLRDFTERNDLPISGLTLQLLAGALLWVWTPYLLLGRRLPWRRLLPTGVITTCCIAAYSIGAEIFLPGIFTQNAERYGLIGIAFGIVSYLFGYSIVAVASAVTAGVWDQRRHGVTAAS